MLAISLILPFVITLSLGNTQGNECPDGYYKSDFLSGNCSPCPELLDRCNDQQTVDANRCFVACRQKLTTTSTPALVETSKTMTSTSQPRTTSTEPCAEGKYRSDYLFIGACTPCPKSLSQCDDQQTDDRRRCRLACARWSTTSAPTLDGPSESPKKTTLQPYKATKIIRITEADTFIERFTTARNEQPTGQNNLMVVGILVSVCALFILVFVCVMIYVKNRSSPRKNGDQRMQNDHCDPVSNDCRSDSDQDINAPEGRLESKEETVIDVEDDIQSSMTTLSVSREDFRSMPESSV